MAANEHGKYRYFNIDRIRKLADISEISKRSGEALIRDGMVALKKISAGYMMYADEMVVDAEGVGHTDSPKQRDFNVKIVFSKREIIKMKCRCPQCMREESARYYGYTDIRNCAYCSALLDQTEKYLEEHSSIGDATDRAGNKFLNGFKKERERSRKAGRMALMRGIDRQNEGIELIPRLTKSGGALELGFRIGNSKKFIIKNFSDFYEHVKNAENAMYGTKTEISHDPEDFTPEARRWLNFIMRIVQEDSQQYERMQDLANGSLRKPKQSVIALYGWRLDKFWEMMQGGEVEYEDRDEAVKSRFDMKFEDGDPDIIMNIARRTEGEVLAEESTYIFGRARWKKTEDDGVQNDLFEGVDVSMNFPQYWQGVENLYFLAGNSLLRAGREFSDGIKPLLERAEERRIAFRVGRNRLSEFYHDVVPELKKYVTVNESGSEEIHEHVHPEVAFTFYLDSENGALTCSAFASYGDDEFCVSDMVKSGVFVDPFRQKRKESEVAEILMQMFGEYDSDEDLFVCRDDEDQLYYIVSEGADILHDYGEVMSTNNFKIMNTARQMKVSVGVSVSHGLLNLEILTDDISRGELLEILREYKPNRKFYRLKNGDFLDMQSESLVMLNELVQTMNISMKELLKDQINIPAYRTLYLDTLLDENRSVYVDRDRKFRQLVRNFRTVSDADFDEPASLSSTMRSYQKDGFKWIKTLGEYGFGGILADDMGLGKTLQAVAVLLSEKVSADDRSGGAEVSENEKRKTSIVISPASLVYNWLEEIGRYAPELKVLVVAGTQPERRALIENWNEYDVLITSYDLLKRDIDCYDGKEFFYEIIDEAQYIKNHTTAAAKAVKVIQSRRKLALTGTPVENRLSELWSIFDFLMPGFLYNYETFKRKFEAPVVKLGDENAIRRLQQMVSPFILRRLKKDVLKDLPDKLEENRVVQFEEKQQRVYDAQVVHMQDMIASQSSDDFGRNRIQILAELMKLRQICCDPSLCFNNYDGNSAKLDSCMDLVESAIDGEHRILIFSQFTSMLEILKGELEKRGIEFYIITGATPKKERLELVRAFNENKIPVFLISLKAGGTGLNLTGADIVIHYDPWWNVAAQNQATDRAHRIGQMKKVTVYKMIVKNSIEEKIQKLQEAKQNLADSIVSAADGINLAQLSREELLDLLK